MGTVFSCIPGHRAFVQTDNERFILERHAALARREYVRFVIGRTFVDTETGNCKSAVSSTERKQRSFIAEKGYTTDLGELKP